MDNQELDTIVRAWPVPREGIRLVIPTAIIATMECNPLSADLHPTSIGHYPQGQGHNSRHHVRPSSTIFYCMSGEASLSINGRSLEARAGDVVIVPLGAKFALKQHPIRPWAVRFITYKGLRDQEYTDMLGTEPVARIGIQPAIVASFEKLLTFRHQMFDPIGELHVAALTKALILELSCAIFSAHKGRAGRWMAALKEWINARLDQPFDLDQLAREAGISKFHFCRKFREETGFPPIRYIQHLRIQRACELLSNTNKSIQEIADATGYNDTAHFCRVFASKIGEPPGRYRRSHVN